MPPRREPRSQGPLTAKVTSWAPRMPGVAHPTLGCVLLTQSGHPWKQPWLLGQGTHAGGEMPTSTANALTRVSPALTVKGREQCTVRSEGWGAGADVGHGKVSHKHMWPGAVCALVKPGANPQLY